MNQNDNDPRIPRLLIHTNVNTKINVCSRVSVKYSGIRSFRGQGFQAIYYIKVNKPFNLEGVWTLISMTRRGQEFQTEINNLTTNAYDVIYI